MMKMIIYNATFDKEISNSPTHCSSKKNPKIPFQVNMSYPKLKGFKIGHLNIASLPKHIDELKLFMKELSFNILCINETRLDNTINDNIMKILGYDIVRRDRYRNGGGVAIYVRSIISYKNHI